MTRSSPGLPVVSTAERRARLVARHHLHRTATDVQDAVDGLLALHSSDPLTPHLALAARVEGYAPDQLEPLLLGGGLRRVHAMRRTLWVVPEDWLGVLDGAVCQKLARAERTRLHKWLRAAGHPPELLGALERETLAAVGRRPGVGTRELTTEVPGLATRIVVGSGRWTSEVSLASRYLMVLAMEHRLARGAPAGSWRSSQYGWWVPGTVDPVGAEAARAGLVAGYLDRFGPATETDIKWWTGLTLRQVRSATQALGTCMVQVEEGVAHDAEGAVSPELRPGVALLPGLDPTPMGHKERGWFLAPEVAAQLFDRNGNIGPSVWVDGRIVGGFAVAAGGELRLRLLLPVEASRRAEVDAAAHVLEQWLDGVEVTPRFRTPLERALVG